MAKLLTLAKSACVAQVSLVKTSFGPKCEPATFLDAEIICLLSIILIVEDNIILLQAYLTIFITIQSFILILVKV